MADQLATALDLAALLQQDLDLSSATLVIEMATALVQEAAGGQRIVQVVDDPFEIGGTTDSWLNLPQIPVTAVASLVRDDGEAVTIGTGVNADYKLIGNRLWSRCGWQAALGWGAGFDYPSASGRVFGVPGDTQTPTKVTGLYTHGYATGHWKLQLGRTATLGLAKAPYANPSGRTSTHIDDYSEAYDVMAARMEASPYLKNALRRQYGRPAGLARIG
jgi:hypothetical protein